MHIYGRYYVTHLVSLMFLVAGLEATSFFIESDSLADRFSVSGTMVLTAVAFYFVVIEKLPNVSYSTHLDKWLMGCFGLMFSSGMPPLRSKN